MFVYFSPTYLNALQRPPSTANPQPSTPEMDEAALALIALFEQIAQQQPATATPPPSTSRGIFTPDIIRYIQEERLFLELQKDVVLRISHLAGQVLTIPAFSLAFSKVNPGLKISWPGRDFQEGRITATEALNRFRRKMSPESVVPTRRAPRREVAQERVPKEVRRLNQFAVRFPPRKR